MHMCTYMSIHQPRCMHICVCACPCAQASTQYLNVQSHKNLILMKLAFFRLPCSILQLLFLESCGDLSLFLLSARQCGEERWSGYYLLLITLLNLSLLGRDFQMAAVLRWANPHSCFLLFCLSFWHWVLIIVSESSYRVLQVMISKPRSDLHVNLPALQKLDAMLLVHYSLFGIACTCFDW